jgi:hypothetical protein
MKAELGLFWTALLLINKLNSAVDEASNRQKLLL